MSIERPDAALPLIFVADLDEPVAEDADRHHLSKALRVRSGDDVTVCDGRGAWRRCRWGEALEPTSELSSADPPTPELTVAFALVKGSRPELVTQKLTELGIDVIVPFVAERSVVRWSLDRQEHHLERLGRVAREAGNANRNNKSSCRARAASSLRRHGAGSFRTH